MQACGTASRLVRHAFGHSKARWEACLPRCNFFHAVHSPGPSVGGRGRARENENFRVAVVGSGPAGFYTAYRVMTKVPTARIDMYESLPVPFGLVRFGVAPDHPEVKNCQDKFDEVATSPNFTFIGNMSVGRPPTHVDGQTIPLQTLLRHYHAVVFAYGAAQDRELGIPGESTLRGIYSARQFVGWYNGLPECSNLEPNLKAGEEVVVIGQGNVALDVARILLEDIDILRKTDISEAALAQLAESTVKRVHIVGRRGPMQAAFTIKEARELMKMANVAFHPVERSLIPPDIKSLPRASRRLMELLTKGSAASLSSATRSWSADFCLSPARFISGIDQDGVVQRTEFQRTELSAPFDPEATPRLTGETLDMPSAIVFRSIGYRSVPLPGFVEVGIPFDERRGIIGNDGLGRVLQAQSKDGTAVRPPAAGLYCSGWVKRGPTGVIASTMEDAFSTGDSISQDWLSGLPFLGTEQEVGKSGWDGVADEIGGLASTVVTWSDWQRIDQREKARGRERGKEREKFTSTAEMLAALD